MSVPRRKSPEGVIVFLVAGLLMLERLEMAFGADSLPRAELQGPWT